jgi:hypothetical protein
MAKTPSKKDDFTATIGFKTDFVDCMVASPARSLANSE